MKSDSVKYMNEELKQFIQDEARKIAVEIYNQKATQFGVSQTAAHSHNGIDSQLLPPTSLSNVQTLSSQTGGVLNGITVSNIPSPVTIFPTPVILTSAPSGTAPEGTMVLAYNSGSGATHLYARVQSAWVKIAPLA